MKTQTLLEDKLKIEFEPLVLNVINESPQHQVPEGSESHFRVIIVSEKFEGLPTIKRHQMVYSAVSKELRESIHAFSQQTFTPLEWEAKGGSLTSSPPCVKKS